VPDFLDHGVPLRLVQYWVIERDGEDLIWPARRIVAVLTIDDVDLFAGPGDH
jgi:hypothetical protein